MQLGKNFYELCKAETVEVLHWSSLTGVVNEIKSPNVFLQKMIFGSHESKETEKMELGILTRSRKMAPFVRKNGMALEMKGGEQEFQTVKPPKIRVKIHLEPSELMDNRRPGFSIFPAGGEVASAAEQEIARKAQVLSDGIAESIEYLCAQALRGTLSYSADEQEVFTVTYDMPAGNTYTLSTKWDDVDALISQDFMNAQEIASDEVGLGVTDCIMSASAAQAFMANEEVRFLLTSPNSMNAGALNLAAQFRDDGALLLGEFCGVRCWRYGRETVLPSGSSYALIEDKKVIFLHNGPAAENRMYFGPIHDLTALQGRQFVGERFAKQWIQEDPSVMWMLVESNPLPWPRRPGSIQRVTVLA
jgi:hypothetical protein